MKHSAPAAPTDQERQALRIHRHNRRAVLSALIGTLRLQAMRFAALAKVPSLTSRP
ncbi:hypothetical protein [Primorskyibacter sp. S187A]|uniref:hypothetical protein n=1 Tax=Primorskyibacter sp. S187A TaxID=3415130 RepID=UPI003C7E28BE